MSFHSGWSANNAAGLVAACALVAATATVSSGALIGQWTFNEPSGSIAYDSSGSGTNGDIYGAVRVAGAGVSDTNFAMHFDGVDDFIEYAHTAAYDVAGDFSIEAWIRIDPTSPGESLVFGQAVARYGMSIDADNVYQYVDNDPYFYKGGTFRYGDVEQNPWRHVVAVWDQTTNPESYRLEIFVDYNLDYYLFDPTTTISPDHNSGSYLTGKSAFGFLKGDIDEIRYYDHALTGSEIAASFAAGPTLEAVPEPSTLSVIGLAGLLLCRFRRGRQNFI